MTITPEEPDPDGGVNRPDPPADPTPDPTPDPFETGPMPLAPSDPMTRPETD